MRTSEPNIVLKLSKRRGTVTNTTFERSSTLKKVDENYFNRHFAHTPTATDIGMEALQEAKEDEEDDWSQKPKPNQVHRASFRASSSTTNR